MKRWAMLTAALYGVILLLLTLPLLLICYGLDHDPQEGWKLTFGPKEIGECYAHWGLWLWLAVMLAGQALLLLVPLDVARARPVRRRRLWVPVVTGGFFIGNLVLAGLLSLLGAVFKDAGLLLIGWPAAVSKELAENLPPIKAAFASLGLPIAESFFAILTIIALVAIFWAVWGMIFYRYAKTDAPDTLSQRATRWLLRGSALELLVAVPSHIIVRQRDVCCAPIATFWGITIGLSVMLMSFGPGVFFLFAARMKRLKPRPPGV